MIKGVNKTIIEVNSPESIYFEKAVFYLRPEVQELPPEISRDEVNRCISEIGLEYGRRRNSSKIFRACLYFGLAAAVGVIIFALVF